MTDHEQPAATTSPAPIIEHEIRPPNRGERGPRGHFAPGNKFSAGRKKRPLLYRDVREILKQEDVERIVDDLRRLAGDPAVEVGSRIAASKVLLDRYFGPPKPPPVQVPLLEHVAPADEDLGPLALKLVQAVFAGTIDQETGKTYLAMLGDASDTLSRIVDKKENEEARRQIAEINETLRELNEKKPEENDDWKYARRDAKDYLNEAEVMFRRIRETNQPLFGDHPAQIEQRLARIAEIREAIRLKTDTHQDRIDASTFVRDANSLDEWYRWHRTRPDLKAS